MMALTSLLRVPNLCSEVWEMSTPTFSLVTPPSMLSLPNGPNLTQRVRVKLTSGEDLRILA